MPHAQRTVNLHDSGLHLAETRSSILTAECKSQVSASGKRTLQVIHENPDQSNATLRVLARHIQIESLHGSERTQTYRDASQLPPMLSFSVFVGNFAFK